MCPPFALSLSPGGPESAVAAAFGTDTDDKEPDKILELDVVASIVDKFVADERQKQKRMAAHKQHAAASAASAASAAAASTACGGHDAASKAAGPGATGSARAAGGQQSGGTRRPQPSRVCDSTNQIHQDFINIFLELAVQVQGNWATAAPKVPVAKPGRAV